MLLSPLYGIPELTEEVLFSLVIAVGIASCILACFRVLLVDGGVKVILDLRLIIKEIFPPLL
jgi:hypothetical protein